LTIEQHVIGNDNSFSHWLCYKLRHVASMGGNTYPNAFGVYTKKTGSQILLSSSYKKDFGSDYEKAFNSLKNDIANFLEDIKQENYDNYEKYRRIDRRVSVGERFEEKTPMVYKNLALVEWKKTVPELADWSNQMVLDFCLC
jgi:hypothetical protein